MGMWCVYCSILWFMHSTYTIVHNESPTHDKLSYKQSQYIDRKGFDIDIPAADEENWFWADLSSPQLDFNCNIVIPVSNHHKNITSKRTENVIGNFCFFYLEKKKVCKWKQFRAGWRVSWQSTTNINDCIRCTTICVEKLDLRIKDSLFTSLCFGNW